MQVGGRWDEGSVRGLKDGVFKRCKIDLEDIPSAALSDLNAEVMLSSDGSITVICTASSALAVGAIFELVGGTKVSLGDVSKILTGV